MKTEERHQQGRIGDFIVKLNKNTFFTILLLNKKWDVTFFKFVS